MYTIILSCNHQLAQNSRPPTTRDFMHCPLCNQSREILSIQEHSRDLVPIRRVVSRMIQAGPSKRVH